MQITTASKWGVLSCLRENDAYLHHAYRPGPKSGRECRAHGTDPSRPFTTGRAAGRCCRTRHRPCRPIAVRIPALLEPMTFERIGRHHPDLSDRAADRVDCVQVTPGGAGLKALISSALICRSMYASKTAVGQGVCDHARTTVGQYCQPMSSRREPGENLARRRGTEVRWSYAATKLALGSDVRGQSPSPPVHPRVPEQ